MSVLDSSPIRSRLERLLPRGWLPYLLHLRPRAWPIVSAHMTVGFLLAGGAQLSSGNLGRWALAVLAWGVLGNGGTLAINSVYDRDSGDIGYLENPPPVPRHLLAFSLAALFSGLLVAALLGSQFLATYSACLVMSILYSVPPFRAKARAGFDLLINSLGFGGLTVFAGWAALARPITPPIVAVTLGFLFLFAAFYPLTQIYQMGEDRARGDHTLALAIGKRNALRLALGAVVVAFVFFLGEAAARYLTWRAVGLVIALGLWLALVLRWLRRGTAADVRFEQRGFYQALWVWAITDIAVVIALFPSP